MEDVQEARKIRGNGPIRLISSRTDSSYNAIRSTFRLQSAEKRKSDIHNFVSSIRLGIDYDVYKARAMALLHSKARTIFFIMMDLVVDVLFCVLYLAEAQYLVNKDSTPYPNPNWLFVPRPKAIWIIAVAMSSWNVMSALIRFIFADSKWRFIFSLQTLLDAVTAIPFLVSGAFLPNGQWLYVPYFLRSWSVISRLQRALSIGVDIGISDQPFDPVKAKLIALVAYLVAILYNGMAAFLYCETMFAPPTESPHTIWDAFYFILITASTVGYGDITPKSFEGQIVVLIFIIVALAIIPGLIAGTIETLKVTRSGGGSYIQSKYANGALKPYLIMIGDFQSARRVGDMLNGFFNKEFSDTDVRVVFLSKDKPSRDVKTLLDMPMHKNRASMLVGNGLDESDLKRCQAKGASAVFIIPDRSSPDMESQDTMTTLLAWSVHLYAPSTRIFTYNTLPETESFQWGIVEQSMCISDVKQLLLAYNCRHQGTSTLILNLLHPSEPANSYDEGWQAQYGDGTGNELYVGPVPEVFVGWTFAQAAFFVFQEFQSVLIGVDIFLETAAAEASCMNEPLTSRQLYQQRQKSFPSQDRVLRSKTLPRRGSSSWIPHKDSQKPDDRYHLILNPGNSYRLTHQDQLIYVAQSPRDIDAINRFTTEQYERLMRDERGYLDNCKADFLKAMEMYFSLRESRAEARAAARRRAEQRKCGKQNRQHAGREMSSHLVIPTLSRQTGFACGANVGHSYKSPASPTSSWPRFPDGPLQEDGIHADQRSHPISSPPGSRAGSYRPRTQPQSSYKRPAWNVALYDDNESDDESDESNDEDLTDAPNDAAGIASDSDLKKKKSGRSSQGHTSLKDVSQRSDGTLENEKEKLSAQSKDDISTADDLRGGRGTQSGLLSHPPQVHPSSQHQHSQSAGMVRSTADRHLSQQDRDTEFYPSNFDRNAAAAAAAYNNDAGVDDTQDDSTREKKSMLVDAAPASKDEQMHQQQEPHRGKLVFGPFLPRTRDVPLTTNTIEATSSGSENEPRLSKEHPSNQHIHGLTSVLGAFQPLDETTYIGQASVTRSEAQDLPLCHLLIQPPESIKPLIREDLSSLEGHILVCANAGETLYRFLATLRLAQIRPEDIKTIVVLTKNPLETNLAESSSAGDNSGKSDSGSGPFDQGLPCEKRCSIGKSISHEEPLNGDNWDAVLAFPRVHWVSGNCRRQRDLVRAGILGASKIVIMSHIAKGLDRDEFADSTAIMSHHMIYQTLQQRDLLGRQHIVVDIYERSNIRFLSMRDWTMTPTRQTLLDYGRALPVRELPSGTSGKNSNGFSNVHMATNRGSSSGNGSNSIGSGGSGTTGFMMTPLFASGQVLVSTLIDNVLFQSYSKRHILDLIKLCCGVRLKQAIEIDQMLGIDCSSICLIPIPRPFVGQSFLKLFQMLALTYGIVPLGLYRQRDQELNNMLPFVFTNPLPGILLKATDMVYVLKS